MGEGSAIWLRLEFSTQTKSTRFISSTQLQASSTTCPFDLRLHRRNVGRAGRAIGRAGRFACVVSRRIAKGVEAFPTRALRVFRPELVRSRVAADGRVFRHDGTASGIQSNPDGGELGGGIHLQAEVIDAKCATGVGDGEIDARIVEHPLRVVVLAD